MIIPLINLVLLLIRLIVGIRTWRKRDPIEQREILVGMAVAMVWMTVGIGAAIWAEVHDIESKLFDIVLIAWMLGVPIAGIAYGVRYEKRKKLRKEMAHGFPVINVKRGAPFAMPPVALPPVALPAPANVVTSMHARRATHRSTWRVRYDEQLDNRAFELMR